MDASTASIAKIWLPAGQTRLPRTAPVPSVDRVDAADARVHVEARRVRAKARDHARRADERDVVPEAQPARPARQPGDGLDVPARDRDELAVAAVVDPEAAAGEPRRVRPRQPAATGSRVAPPKITPRPSTGKFRWPGRRRGRRRRGGEVGRADRRARGDRVQLEVVPREVGAVRRPRSTAATRPGSSRPRGGKATTAFWPTALPCSSPPTNARSWRYSAPGRNAHRTGTSGRSAVAGQRGSSS